MVRLILTIILLVLVYYLAKLLLINSPSDRSAPKNVPIPLAYLVNDDDVKKRLRADVEMLAGTIGVRSLYHPGKLNQAKDFLKDRLGEFGPVKGYPYTYNGLEVVNLELDIFAGPVSAGILIIGAHYDTVSTTPGADDNASALALLLELARQTARLKKAQQLKKNLRFVVFTLEEPPAFNTDNMGSKRYVKTLKQRGEKISGMICLEMVGFSSSGSGSQEIPFPLNLRNYPRIGDFIAFVANTSSLPLLKKLISCTKYKNTLYYQQLVVPGKGRLFPLSRLSDHIAFWDEGYPAVMITDTAFLRNPHYHAYGDKPETLDYHFMMQLVQTLVLFLNLS